MNDPYLEIPSFALSHRSFRRATTLHLGNLYVAPIPEAAAEGAIDWVCVRLHPDDDTIGYFVPVDECPLVGICDVVVKHEGRKLVLRCADGVWASGDKFTRLLGRVYTEEARRMLAAIVRGPMKSSAARLENEADPDYQFWMAEVREAAGRLQQWSEKR